MSEEPDVRITFKNVELTVGGWIFVPDPAGSYPIEPDDPRLFLAAVVAEALERAGLGERATEVTEHIRDIVAPHFAADVARFEAIRQRVADGE